jgi:hypothetical protein
MMKMSTCLIITTQMELNMLNVTVDIEITIQVNINNHTGMRKLVAGKNSSLTSIQKLKFFN